MALEEYTIFKTLITAEDSDTRRIYWGVWENELTLQG